MKILFFASLALLCLLPPTPSQGLAAALDRYLSEPEDTRAEAALQEILANPATNAAELLQALLTRPSGPIAESGTYRLPSQENHLEVHYATPAGHSHSAAPLPLVMNISGGVFAQHFNPPVGFIQVCVPKFNPPEFSDEGREAFLKVARDACHRLNGDPHRLWLTGFSWAAHASSDIAVHRPGFVRAIAPLGGGPRRTHYRLFKNLADTKIRFYCGEQDDPELVWNLREVLRRAPELKLDVRLNLDPDQGHIFPLRGSEQIEPDFAETLALPDQSLADAYTGFLLADAPKVESPILRCDRIDEARVKVPPRVPVPASASHDEQRRLTIKAYEKAIVTLKCQGTVDPKSGAMRVSVSGDGVFESSLFLRAPRLPVGTQLVVTSGGKKHFEGPTLPDAATLLREARRTGERLRPTYRIVTIRLR